MTETFIIHTNTTEQKDALKAFVKALKMKFEISKEKIYNLESQDGDSKEDIIKNIKVGLKELKQIQEGKLKGRPAKELLNEL